MNLKRKFTILLIILMTPLLMGASYNYSFFGEVLHSSPGYNYVTHFDQQILGFEYTDPQDFKVYNDQIYLLAKTADRTKDVLLILNQDYEIVKELYQFELTEDYKEYIQSMVNEAFAQIKELYENLFEENVIYPGNNVGFDLVNKLIPSIEYEFKSDRNIDKNGVTSNKTDEAIIANLELTMTLWGQTEVLNFPVTIGTEQEGFKATGKFFSYEVDELISVDALNEVIGSDYDSFKYENIKELIEENKNLIVTKDEHGEEIEPENKFEYEGFIFEFEESTNKETEEVFSKIIVTKINDEISSSDINGTIFQTEYTTNKAQGLEVVDSGIYIADTDNNRIIKLNHDFEVIDGFFGVEDETFEKLDYRPLKVTVDSSERMYVVAAGVFEGIIELDSDGDFNRYTGVNPIKLTPFEIFKRLLMTESQKSKLQSFLPTSYTNLSLNDKSFIYATAKPRENNADDIIQLINPKGIDVLKRNGYHNPMGDIMYMDSKNNYVIEGPSDLSDIAIGKDGIYSVLDSKRSRIFTYDSEGNLLYVNGDKGQQSDKFTNGIALNYFQDNLVVLDSSGTMIVYRPTEFGETVNKAVSLHNDGKFLDAADEWEKVLKLNTNYEIAYNGIGKYNLRDGNYKEAMKNFKLGHDQHYYSKAFKAHRNNVVKANFTWVVSTIIVIAIGVVAFKQYKKYKKGE